MKLRLPVLLLLTACDAPPTPTQPPAPPEVATAPTPAPASAPATAAPVPPPGEPPRLHVAFEGRCTGLGTSLLGDQMFVHYRENYPNARSVIARLGADARPAERVIQPRNDVDLDLTAIVAMAGRWPNQLYLNVGTGERGGYETGYFRFDDKAWSRVVPFGEGGHVDHLYPWHSDSLLAVGSDETNMIERLAVIRGAPKAPRLDAVRAALGCAPRRVAIRVLESGPVVSLWSCAESGKGLVAARFTPDDLKGELHILAGPEESAGGHLAEDGRDTVYVLLQPSGTTSPGRLFASAPGKWSELGAAPSGWIKDLAVDPQGELWLLQSEALLRRSGGKWVPEQVGVTNMGGLVGVEVGKPWVHTEIAYTPSSSALVRRDPDGTWKPVALPRSTLFPEQQLEPASYRLDADGELWVDAWYSMKRRSDRSPMYRFDAVLTTRPVDAALRCGEVLGKPMTESFAPWPSGVDAQCKSRLVLLQREAKWKPTETYAKLRKALKGATDVGAPRFAELEIGGDKFVAAIVDTDAAAQSLLVRARKVRAWAFPEVLCGDQAILDRTGVQVHRPLTIDLTTGELRPGP